MFFFYFVFLWFWHFKLAYSIVSFSSFFLSPAAMLKF